MQLAKEEKSDKQLKAEIDYFFVNPERPKLELKDVDLSPWIQGIYKTDLSSLRSLKILKLENCKIDYFEPQELTEQLLHVSLQNNKIRDLDSIVFGKKLEKFNLGDVRLETLDLSSNYFTKFPYDALSFKCPKQHGGEKDHILRSLNLSRNRISDINRNLDFTVFENLRLLDLSSNRLKEFPICVKECPRLNILRLIFNQIETIPIEFYRSLDMINHLQELNMNSNPLKELSPSVKSLQKLIVLGISYTEIKELPSTVKDLPELT